MRRTRPRPCVLIIRDGWGVNPHSEWNHANAVYLARTPVDDHLTATYPHTLIRTSGTDVGLPEGVMGNSEVGHQNIGAGRIVEQEVMRITNRIRDESFYDNPELIAAFDQARRHQGAVHFMGLCSDGRVHSDIEHLFALLEMSRRLRFPGERVFVHAFTDGRDTPPNSGLRFIEKIEEQCRRYGVNPVASVIGRYYAMDRDHRWQRTRLAYDMLVHGKGDVFSTACEALRHYYQHPSDPSRKGDEFVTPCVIPIKNGSPATINDGDSIIFFNFRGDRPRQLVQAFVLEPFPYTDESGQQHGFDRGPKRNVHFVTMTAYEEDLPVSVAFPKPPRMKNILGAFLSDMKMRQFRCAETEKYAHVTFFFNDYRDDPYPGEDRLLIPSPRDVPTYDRKPEMSAPEVTRAVVERINTGIDDVIVLNYANGDMVGHTGVLKAAIRAIETVDECVGRVVEAARKHGGVAIVTADHGNAEQMTDPATGGPCTTHTTFPVACILVDDSLRGRSLRSHGRLADIAPTLLCMMGLNPPQEMTGRSLLDD